MSRFVSGVTWFRRQTLESTALGSEPLLYSHCMELGKWLNFFVSSFLLGKTGKKMGSTLWAWCENSVSEPIVSAH